jgi:hypothetical protein
MSEDATLSVAFVTVWWRELLRETEAATGVHPRQLLEAGHRPSHLVSVVRRQLIRRVVCEVGPEVAEGWLQVVTGWSRKTISTLVAQGTLGAE